MDNDPSYATERSVVAPVIQQEAMAPADNKGETGDGQKRALYWLIAAVVYFVMPFDGDFVLMYIDDALFLWWAYKNYQKYKPQGIGGAPKSSPALDKAVRPVAAAERGPTSSAEPYRLAPPEESDFFARLVKGLKYIAFGGEL